MDIRPRSARLLVTLHAAPCFMQTVMKDSEVYEGRTAKFLASSHYQCYQVFRSDVDNNKCTWK